MAGYFGTESQQRLQAQAESSERDIATTSGACQTGRTMGCDDPDKFGWDRICAILDRDGVFGFRLISAASVAAIRSKLDERGHRFDQWDVFIAERDTALAASSGLSGSPLAPGYSLLPTPKDPDSQQMRDLQALMADAGVVPFSGSMLCGAIGSGTTVVIGDARGKMAACAHGYLPHNKYSPYRQYAWGGLVAVVEAHRGRGLGKMVNAIMIDRVFRELGASHIYELISASNLPSRRMVEACGLRHEPALICGIATAQARNRFTK